MAQNKNLQKLELTWIGKGDEPKLEPRILIENPEYSYGDTNTENMLIHGDNLLALKALEQDYAGKVKCIYIDPPYNTGNAFEHYDDGIEHSLWLNLMYLRLKYLYKLLSEDGVIWITLDDNESHYCKVLCDEIFGRKNFIQSIIWKSSDNSNNDAKQFSIDHNSILVYSKSPNWLSKKLIPKEGQSKHFKNPDNDPRGPWFDGNPISSPAYRENLVYDIETPIGTKIKSPKNGWRWSKETLFEKMQTGEIYFNKDYTNIKRRTYLADSKGLPPSSLWADLEETGHNRQAKYEQKKLFPEFSKSEWFGTPKPEKLIKKILLLCTEENDLVLDSFLGSGTTAAVAHKMGRKYIGIELGEHAITHSVPRLKQVVDGEQGGVSKAVNWQGGGGFKFYTLAPSLLKKDKFGQWIMSDEYNADMLAAAMAKQEGFKYNPSETQFWKQGNSSEQDFIFTTTQFLTVQQLEAIAEDMQVGESLLICCKAFQTECKNKFPNITIKKIPQLLLDRCEFGKDDYSLNIVNIPQEDNQEDYDVEEEIENDEEVVDTKENNQKSLFD
ncbi:site-specific DNA-methyltransferase [Empedobacter falsenii]|uniref:site-specific DNA-methyltransferase n=1 Tax=Empedobacter falsenii TaxID=343874 RepID=UPI001C564EFA|nr:site-specific DNA-methyltransferase [Empedobacter falsenii]MBW1617810.1 site-specific DNA-methyltransferase [Empedobacter falsenii]